ncbi:hypothetical protein NKH37_33570 [Mesorhizobium sp. M1217]|uniref:hypothetical protein n=1 Tax=Mesorhizobium sp. M1217 TaxID=2957070 RepID=UPI0033352115
MLDRLDVTLCSAFGYLLVDNQKIRAAINERRGRRVPCGFGGAVRHEAQCGAPAAAHNGPPLPTGSQNPLEGLSFSVPAVSGTGGGDLVYGILHEQSPVAKGVCHADTSKKTEDAGVFRPSEMALLGRVFERLVDAQSEYQREALASRIIELDGRDTGRGRTWFGLQATTGTIGGGPATVYRTGAHREGCGGLFLRLRANPRTR